MKFLSKMKRCGGNPTSRHGRRSHLKLQKPKSSQAVMLLVASSAISAYSMGFGPCNCSPSSITFKLDLDRSCPPESVPTGPSTGISRIFCEIENNSTTATSIVPSFVSSIQIFELGLDLLSMKETQIKGDFSDGSAFRFRSIVTTENVTLGGMQMRIVGENNKMEHVFNDWIIEFTNECGVQPFCVGDSLGWVTIADVSPPRDDTDCFSGAISEDMSMSYLYF